MIKWLEIGQKKQELFLFHKLALLKIFLTIRKCWGRSVGGQEVGA